MGEKRFWTNLRSLNLFVKSEMQKCVQLYHKSRAKCAKMVFFGTAEWGTQIYHFHAARKYRLAACRAWFFAFASALGLFQGISLSRATTGAAADL